MNRPTRSILIAFMLATLLPVTTLKQSNAQGRAPDKTADSAQEKSQGKAQDKSKGKKSDDAPSDAVYPEPYTPDPKGKHLPDPNPKPDPHSNVEFRTADRCVACHNGLKTSAGEDISIGREWRSSLMGNSARDPYWQGSVRRESIDHPESRAAIEDDCATCHMQGLHLTAKAEGKKAEVFSHFPLSSPHEKMGLAADGVSCSVCHQIQAEGLGTMQTFNGNIVVVAPADKNQRPEYGPFAPDHAHQRLMQSSTGGSLPIQGNQVRDAALCGSCHTLYTKALGPGGKQVGILPEQMPYQEWQHSDYSGKQTCQACHMPEVRESVAITALYGQPREGVRRHQFVGANFVMQRMLSTHHDDLGVIAQPDDLTTAANLTVNFLKTQTAKVTLENVATSGSGLAIEVHVQNLSGHKFPTAYPSRRAWLHLTVRDNNGHAIFESGALNPDGSITGNANDADPRRFEPHHPEITSPTQVEIFEPILGDAQGNVTTGLLSAVRYLKDNRILPTGFDKQSANHDIAVVGEAADDPNFNDKGALIRYQVDTGRQIGPFHIQAELWYQPIGFRWAHNLAAYHASEPQRFVSYYESESPNSATLISKAEATR